MKMAKNPQVQRIACVLSTILLTLMLVPTQGLAEIRDEVADQVQAAAVTTSTTDEGATEDTAATSDDEVSTQETTSIDEVTAQDTTSTDEVATEDTTDSTTTEEATSPDTTDSTETADATDKTDAADETATDDASAKTADTLAAAAATTPSTKTEVTTLSDDPTAQADNGLQVKWLLNKNWSGTGTDTDYNYAPTGNGIVSLQATVGITTSHDYAKGTMTFKINKTLFTYRDGTTTCDITGLGAAKKNSTGEYADSYYFYYEGPDSNGDYTFTNCRDIPSNQTKVFTLGYDVDMGKTKVGTVGTLAVKDVVADPALTTSSAKITFVSSTKIDSVGKTATNNGTGERKLPAGSEATAPGADYWYGKQAGYFDFNANYYMIYEISNNTSGNQPYYATFTDTLSDADIANDAKIIGMSSDYNGLTCVEPINGTTGTYTLGEWTTTNTHETDSTKWTVSGTGTQKCYVLVEYPQAKYPTIDPGQSVTFNNTASTSIRGIDDQKVLNSAEATCEAKWTRGAPLPAGGGDGSEKEVTSDAWEYGAAATLMHGQNVTANGYQLSCQTWDDEYTDAAAKTGWYVPRHNSYAIDDSLYVTGVDVNNPGYTKLSGDDYKLTALTITGTKEYATQEESVIGSDGKPARALYEKDSKCEAATSATDACGEDKKVGHLEVYFSTDGGATYIAGPSYTYAEAHGATVTVSGIPDGCNAFYVEYVYGDYKVEFNANPTWELNGAPTSNVWKKTGYLDKDTNTLSIANQAGYLVTYSTTDKMIGTEDAKDFTTGYINLWNPSTAANAQLNTELTMDDTVWGSHYSTGHTATGATGKGIHRSYKVGQLTQKPGDSQHYTRATTTSNVVDVDKGRVIRNFNTWGDEWYLMSGANLTDALTTGTTLVRNNGKLYVLLATGQHLVTDGESIPDGTTNPDGTPHMITSKVSASGASDAITADVTTTVTVNYNGTGRDMVEFDCSATNNTYIPGTTAGNAVNGNNAYLQAGFKVKFNTYVDYADMSDASVIPVLSAYQIPQGETLLGTTGTYADQVDMADNQLPTAASPRPNIQDTNSDVTKRIFPLQYDMYINNTKSEGHAFNNLAESKTYDPTTMKMDGKDRTLNTRYDNTTAGYQAQFSANSGLIKNVARATKPDAGKYSQKITVDIGEDYQYKLEFSNTQYIKCDNMVLYDNFEAAGTGTKWQGTLKSIDTSAAKVKGVDVVIWYSTTANASIDVTDGTWTKYDSSLQPGEDGYVALSDIRAIAFDYRYTAHDATTGEGTTPFILNQLASISATMTFTAPSSMELDDTLNASTSKQKDATTGEGYDAYNSPSASYRYYINDQDKGTADTTQDASKYTTVTLNDPRVDVNISKTDDSTANIADTLGGAKFELKAETSDGKWVDIPGDDGAPYTGTVSSCADTTKAVAGVAVGDIVFDNNNYEPEASSLQTPLKLYPAGYTYSDKITYTGKYKLTETTAPDGYIASADPYYITIPATDTTTTPATKGAAKVWTDVACTKEANKLDDGTYRYENITPDVKVDKTITNLDLEAGTVTYNLAVTNNGDSDLTGYSFTDTASNLTYVSHTPAYVAATKTTSASGVEYTAGATNGKFKIWDKLVAGGTENISVTYSINDTTTGFKNAVPGKSATLDKVRVTDATGATEATGAVSAGDTVYYKLTYTNNSTEDLSDATITDTATEGITLKDATVLTGGGTAQLDDNGAIIWKPGTIAGGKSATVIVTATVNANVGDHITNTATDGKNPVVVTDPVTKMSVNKELKDYTGTTATYTLTVTNNGVAPITGFQFTDSPTNLAYKSHTPTEDVTYAADAAPATSGVFTVTSEIAAGGTKTIDVTYDVTDPAVGIANAVDPGNGFDLSKTRVTSATDMTPVTGGAVDGQTIYYLVTETNNYNDDVDTVKIVDTPSEGLTLVGGTTTSGKAELQDDGTIIWNTGTIAGKGGSVTMLVEAKVNNGASDTLDKVTNTAVDGYNTEVVTTPLTTVDLSKNLVTENATVGDEAEYDITLKNTGAADATLYTFLEDPTGLEYVSLSCADAKVTYDATTKMATVDNVPAGKMITVTFTFTVTNAHYANVAEPQGSDYKLDKKLVTSATDMTEKTDSLEAGGMAYYEVTFKNTGSQTISAQEITDEPTKGITLTKVETKSGDAKLNDDGTATWTTGDVEPGETVTMVVTAMVDEDAVESVVNTAKTGKTTKIVTTPVARVEVAKALTSAASEVGGNAVYTLTLSNVGDGDATNAVVTDTMKNLEYVSSQVTTGNATATWDGTGFTVSNVPVGDGTVVITVTCKTTAASYSNGATTTPSGGATLSKERVDASGNATDTTIYPGDTVYYKITLDNTNGVKDIAAGKTFTDTFTGLKYVSSTGDGSVSADGKTWTAPKVAMGDKVSVTMSFTVGLDTTGQATNSVSADDGSMSTVVVSTVTPTPVTPAKAGVPKTGDSTSPLAIVGLVLAAGVAFEVARRRRQQER